MSIISFNLGNLLVKFVHSPSGKILDRFDDWISPAHFHFFYEVHFIIKGSMNIIIGNNLFSLNENEICIIPPDVLHYPVGDNVINRFTAFFSLEKNDEKNEPVSDEYQYYKNIFNHILMGNLNESIKGYIENISVFEKSDKPLYKCQINAFLTLLFAEIVYLIEDEKIKKINLDNKLFVCKNEDCVNFNDNVTNPRKLLIENFFSNNFMKQITLDDLAAILHYSEKQTARILQTLTGHTFNDILIKCRMEMSKELILNSNYSLKQISEMVGYDSYNGFYKAFKSYFGDIPGKMQLEWV